MFYKPNTKHDNIKSKIAMYDCENLVREFREYIWKATVTAMVHTIPPRTIMTKAFSLAENCAQNIVECEYLSADDTARLISVLVDELRTLANTLECNDIFEEFGI